MPGKRGNPNFVKGHAGSPGRPTKAEELKLIESVLKSGAEITGEDSPLDALWKKVWEQAYNNGSKDHQAFILNYVYGKPKQRVEVENPLLELIITKAED